MFGNSCNILHHFCFWFFFFWVFCFWTGFATVSKKLLRAQLVPADQDGMVRFTQWVDLSNKVLFDHSNLEQWWTRWERDTSCSARGGLGTRWHPSFPDHPKAFCPLHCLRGTSHELSARTERPWKRWYLKRLSATTICSAYRSVLHKTRSYKLVLRKKPWTKIIVRADHILPAQLQAKAAAFPRF